MWFPAVNSWGKKPVFGFASAHFTFPIDSLKTTTDTINGAVEIGWPSNVLGIEANNVNLMIIYAGLNPKEKALEIANQVKDDCIDSSANNLTIRKCIHQAAKNIDLPFMIEVFEKTGSVIRLTIKGLELNDVGEASRLVTSN